ncbi:MAG: prepilin peptidase [Chloroflexi bacterium]|nr:prepilin peptidase [Chloroflexota bacterium]
MSQAAFIFYIVLSGLAVGSFLNVVIDRLPRGQSIVGVASHCEACQRPVAFYDLVPLLSYLWLRGRCRYCQARIPARLPVVEAATGALFGWTAYQHGASLTTVVALLGMGFLLVIFFTDLEYRLILNKVVLPGAVLLLALFPFGPIGREQSLWASYLSGVEGVALGFGVMLLIYVASRGGMGEGDVKLGALIGAVSGFPGVLATLWYAFVVGGIAALALIGAGKRSRKDMMPYGLFMAGAAIAILLGGENIYSWYVDLLTRA